MKGCVTIYVSDYARGRKKPETDKSETDYANIIKTRVCNFQGVHQIC